jgi:hypothetical protein
VNSGPVLIQPARGPAYLWQPRNWDDELVEFLEKEFLSADSRLPPGRIEYFRQFIGGDNAHRALAAVQIEAADWTMGDGSRE